MKKAFSLLFIILSLLAFKNFAFAQQEVDACYNFHKAGDYRRAIEAGRVAVEKYPNDIDAHYCLGTSYGTVGEFKLALEHLKKAESLTSDKEILMYIYGWIGLIYYGMGYLDDALLYLSRSLSLARDMGNKSMQVSALNNMAGIYYKKGELDKALGYYEEFLRLETDEKEKATTYNNIAIIYGNKGDYQKAVEYLQKAIEISERYGDYHGASMRKLNLGEAYRRIKDYEKAEKYILEGLILACYTETKETKRLPKITLLVPMICLNPSVRKGMLREFSLLYKSLKNRGWLYMVGWRLGQRV
jgi:tetratricopeptide (TPR) repeat protein